MLGLVVAGGCEDEQVETIEPKDVELEIIELETVTNSIGMRFKLIPAGEFMMGNSESAEES
jgi:hypothetical protein